MKTKRNTDSPYWDWVSKHGGLEPIENNADASVDPRSVPPAESTNYSASFAVWLQIGYKNLSPQQKNVFNLAFNLQLPNDVGADSLGISLDRYVKIKRRIRKIISDYCGIRK